MNIYTMLFLSSVINGNPYIAQRINLFIMRIVVVITTFIGLLLTLW